MKYDIRNTENKKEQENTIIAVGIDVSKGKSTVALLCDTGEVLKKPYDVPHTNPALSDLTKLIMDCKEDVCVVMEATGNYHKTIANYLCENGISVSVVNPKLIRDFGDNTLRKPKTDKKDAMKICRYALTYQAQLTNYSSENGARSTLKILNRQYSLAEKTLTMHKNLLISYLELVFPGINKMFTTHARDNDGHEKLIDFLIRFPHADMVAKICPSEFRLKYKNWCKSAKYRFGESKAEELHQFARECVCAAHNVKELRSLVKEQAKMVNGLLEHMQNIRTQMTKIAQSLPEYDTVIEMYGLGKNLAVQMMAEVGDVRRFHNRRAVTAYFGYDSETDQSGTHDSKSNPMTKKGSPYLRRTLFMVMVAHMQNRPDNAVYQFLDKKRAEGKNYYSYMTAGSAKFLRIYYAKVKKVMEQNLSE